MKTKLAIALSFLLTTASLSGTANAHGFGDKDSHSSCDVNIEQSIKITPQSIQVLDGQTPMFRIDGGSRLYTEGKRVHLNDEQRAMVEEYSALIQELAPKISRLIADGLIIAKSAINGVITELFGDDAQLKQQVDSIVNKLEQKAAPMMDNTKGEYYLAKDMLDDAGDDFGKEIEQQVENLLKQSGGHMLMLIGKMLVNGDQGMEDFERKMEAFGKDMERQGSELEARANAMCEQVLRLEELENKMQKAIPQFADYDLISLQST